MSNATEERGALGMLDRKWERKAECPGEREGRWKDGPGTAGLPPTSSKRRRVSGIVLYSVYTKERERKRYNTPLFVLDLIQKALDALVVVLQKVRQSLRPLARAPSRLPLNLLRLRLQGVQEPSKAKLVPSKVGALGVAGRGRGGREWVGSVDLPGYGEGLGNDPRASLSLSLSLPSNFAR